MDSTFEGSRQCIIKEALDFGVFTTVKGYTSDSLPSDFKSKNQQILKYKRGCGYWIWKYFLINQTLSELQENEFLVYTNAGCSFNAHGKNRFF